jgi:Flp pilus assembly protein TadD/peroxiredoxin
VPQSPQRFTGSKRYEDGWRAVNELIRSDGSWSGRERHKAFRNRGDGTFEDVSYVAGMDFAGDGRAMGILDYDNDGDQDLVLKFRTSPQVRLMRNEIGAGQGRALIVDLAGTKSNRDAVGAQAVLTTSKRKLLRHVAAGSGYLSQMSRRMHFGLEPNETPRELSIRWPSGLVQSVDGLPATGLVRVHEGAKEVEEIRLQPQENRKPPEPAFRPTEGTWLVSSLPAPNLETDGLDGKRHELADHKGKKVLLTFWATWCPPCRGELRDFSEHAAAFREAGVEVLAVSVDDPEETDKVRAFAGELDLPFPVLLANDTAVATYSVLNRFLFNRRRDLGVPTSFLIDEEGLIVKVYAGEARASSILADAAVMKGEPLPFPGSRFTPGGTRNYLDLGTAMAERGLSAEARGIFEAALGSEDAGWELYTNFASLLLDVGDLEESEKYFRTSLKVKPGQIEAMTNLGTLLLGMGRAEEARQTLEEVRARYPDDGYVLNALGNAEFQLDNLPAAEKHLREAVRVEPDMGEYRYNLAGVLATMGRGSAAIDEFTEAERLGRGGADLHNNLGALYMQIGQTEKAATEFQQALEADPNDFGARMNLAIYNLNAGDPEEGLRQLRTAQELHPDQPAAFLVEAEVLMQRGQTAEARAILEKLLRDQPNLDRARQLLNQIQ